MKAGGACTLWHSLRSLAAVVGRARAICAGLIQQSSHCMSCAAQAAKGLLMHIDAAALEAAEATAAAAACTQYAAHCGAAAAATLAPEWSALSVLLVQLAAAAAAEVRAERGSAAAAAAAGPPDSYLDLQANGSSGGKRVRAAGDGSAAASDQQGVVACSALQLWLSLQDCFAERQSWWGSCAIADLQELQLLWQWHQQLEQQLQRQKEQQQQRQQQQAQAGSTQRQPQVEQRQLSGHDKHDTPHDGSMQQPGEPSQLCGVHPNASQHTQRVNLQQSQYRQLQLAGSQSLANGEDAVEAASLHDSGGSEGSDAVSWTQHHQLLCCKAVALAFVLGHANAYSQAAAAAVAAAAKATAAAAEAGGNSSAEAEGLLVFLNGGEDDVQLAPAAAR